MSEKSLVGNAGFGRPNSKVAPSTPFRRSAIFAVAALLAPFGVLGSVLLFSQSPVEAAINEQLHFQARLLSAGGSTPADGDYNVQFHIYSGGDGDPGTADETLEWSGSYLKGNTQAIHVANGYVSAQLGETASAQVNTLADVPWDNATLWMSINIGDATSTSTTCTTEAGFNTNCGGDGEMGPFLRLGATPYAFNSKQLDGRTASEFVQLNPGATPQAVSTGNSAVAVNQTGAGNVLQLQSGGSDVLVINNSGTATFSNDVVVNGNTTIGNANTDTLSINSVLQGTNALVFEGATPDGFEATLAIQDPTADVTFRLPALAAGTYDLCTTSGNCNGLGDILQGGNTYGAAIRIGSNDSYDLEFETNDTLRVIINATTGNVTLTGDLAVNGDDITSDGDLTITPAGGDLISAANLTVTSGNNLTLANNTNCVSLKTNGTGTVSCGANEFTYVVAASDSVNAATANYTGNGDTGAANDGDQVEINAAIAAADTAGGGTVFLLEGTYIIDDTILLENNVTLMGSGTETIIRSAADGGVADNFNMIENSDQSGGNYLLTIQDLTIDGNNSNISASTRDSINFVKVGSGVGSGALTGFVIDNVHLLNSQTYGLAIDDSRNSRLSNSVIRDGGGSPSVSISSSDRIQIDGNRIVGGGGTGVQFTTVDDSTITNNVFDTVGNSGDRAIGLADGSDNNVIDSNTIQDTNGIAIEINGSTGSNANVISNNNISGSVDEAIYLTLAFSTNVTGNTLYDNEDTAGATDAQILLTGNADENQIVGNFIQDDSGSQSYAINLSGANVNNTYLADNYLLTTDGILNTGTNTSYANQSDGSGNLRIQAQSTNTINLQSNTTVTGNAGGSGAALTINTGAATNVGLAINGAASQSFNFVEVNPNGLGYSTFKIDANGNTSFRPVSDSGSSFLVTNAAGTTTLLSVDSSAGIVTSDGSLSVGGSTTTGTLFVNVAGSLLPYTTPGSSTIYASGVVDNWDYGTAQQGLVVGVGAGSDATARGIIVFDARTTTNNQQSIGVFSPDESDILGFSWEGANTTGYIKTLTGTVGLRVGSTNSATFGASAISLLQDTTASGTLSVNGNTTIGNANTDTLTVNAGTSGTGIRFTDATFANCTALETDASGDLTCGTDSDTGATITLQTAYDNDANGSNAVISLNSTDGAFVLQDAASTIGTLFTVEANGGADYLSVASTGTTVTGPTGGSSTALTVNAGNASNSGLVINGAASQTSPFLEVAGNGAGYDSFLVDGTGRTKIRPLSDTSDTFVVYNTAGTSLFGVDATTGVVTSQGSYYATNGADIANINLHGTAMLNFTTPQSSTVTTKINIPLFNPGASNQILALGLPNGAATNSRAISIFDDRAAGDNQPVLSVFSPDESDVFGLSSDGSNSYGYLKATSGLGLGIKSGATIAATFETTGNAVFNYDLAVNGGDITSTGNLTVNATGYTRIGDSGTPGVASGDDDLYVEGDLEVDGSFIYGANASATAWGLNGISLQAVAATYTDSSTAGSGTATNAVFNSFAAPTLAASNSSVTTTNAATVYVQGAPSAGANQTITNAYALWVDGGLTRLDGNFLIGDAEMGNAGFQAEIQGSTTASVAITAGDSSSSSILYLGVEGNETGQGALSYDNNTDIFYLSANGGSGTITLDGNSTLTVGTNAATGELSISDGSSNYATIDVDALAGNYTVSIPTISANDEFCLLTAANCGSNANEFTAVVGTSVDSSNAAAADYTANGDTGAGGDGDQVEINSAITAVNAAGGGKVLLLEGTYTIDATIDIKSDVELVGSGQGATIIRIANGLNSNMFVISESTNPSNFTIRDLSIDANDSNNTGTQGGIAILTAGSDSGATSARGPLIENVEIHDLSDNGIYFDDVNYGTIADSHIYDGSTYGIWLDSSDVQRGNIVRNNQVHDMANTAVVISDAPGTVVSGNTIKNSGISGLMLSSSNGVTASDNYIYNNVYAGIELYGGQNSITGNHINTNEIGVYGEGIGWTSITGNDIGETTTAGIFVEELYYSNVTGNTIYNSTGNGIELSTDAGTNPENTISGNNISNIDGKGILLTTSAQNNIVTGNNINTIGLEGIDTAGADYTQISDNYIYNFATVTAGSDGIAITGDSDNNSIIANRITDGGSGQAIDIGASANNTYLADNTYSGTGASSINDGGTNTIFGNQLDSSGNIELQAGDSGVVELLSNTDVTGTLTVSSTATLNGNTVVGDANTDTLTVNAGTSGTGIRFTDASFAGCTALETDASGDLTCGADADTGATLTLDGAYNNFGATPSKITVDAAQGQTGGLEFESTGANDIFVDLQGTGDFAVQDGGSTVFGVSDSGVTTLTKAGSAGVVLQINDESAASVLTINTTTSGSSDNSLVFDGVGVFGNGNVDVGYNGGSSIRVGNNFYNDNNWTGGTGGYQFSVLPTAYTGAASADFSALVVQGTANLTSGTGTYSGITLTPTVNQTGGANGVTRGFYNNPTLTAFADYRGLEVSATSSYATANNQQGAQLTVTDTGAVNSGTDTTIGQAIALTRTGATGGTINNTGLNIALTGDTGGTSTNTGLSVSVSGADTNYAALFSGGNVGIGDTTPAGLLTVGNGDLFQVNSSGDVTTANGENLSVTTGTTGTLTLDSGTTGAVSLGANANAKTITIGNITGATALNLLTGTGNFSLDGVAGTTYTLGASTTTGTIAIGGTAQTGNITLGSSSGTNSVLIGNGAGATTVNIANANTAGAVNIGSAFTTGTISIGGTGAQTGTISLGTGTGAQSINLGTGGTGAKTVTLGSTASTGVTTIQAGTGGVLVKPANGTTAFQVQNASSATLLGVDTTNNVLSLLGNNSGEPQTWQSNANTIPAHDNTQNAVVYNGYIYIAGGDNSSSVYSSVAYAKLNADGTTGTWSTTGTLSTAVTNTNSIEANGYLYVLGGSTNVASTNVQSIVQYAKINADGTLGTFTTTSSLVAARKNGSVVTLNGYMYYIGGDSSSSATPAATKTVYYAKINADGTLGTWANVSNSNAGYVTGAGTYGQKAITANGYIYVMGGNGVTSIYYARPGSNGDISSNFTVEATNSIPAGAGNSFQGVYYSNGYLYNVGGFTSSVTQSTAYYAPLNANGSVGTWVQQNTSNDLPAARATYAFGKANGYLYAIGGFNGTTSQTTVYYTSLQRIKAGGNLDLTAYSTGSLTDPSGAGSLTAGNTRVVGTLEVQDQASFTRGANVLGSLAVYQTAASSLGLSVTSNNTGTGQLISLTNTSGTQTAGLSIDRNGSGGTTTSLLSLSNTAGTATNGILFTGTIGTDITTAAGSGASAGRTLFVSAGAGGATGIGGAITLRAGTGGATSGSGGALTLQGGSGGASGSNGGNVLLVGGASGGGAGVKGLVVIDTPAYSTVSNTACGAADCTIAQTNVDSYGAIIVTFSSTGFEAAIPDPTLTTAGRIVYLTAANGTSDFTLCLNDVAAGGTYDGTCNTTTGNSIAMRANTTATLVWNGSDWTAAGASSSTDLQAAYNNTLTSAGGAELVLNASGGAADGLTVRNNSTSPIVGGLLEVQTSIGSNLFSVNNNATEYASNGGAETAGGTSSTFPSDTWDANATGGTVSRYTTVGSYVATGQASVSVVTAAQNQGARNELSTVLTNGLTYKVSFAVRGTTNFSNLEVRYSPDGSNTATVLCSTTAANSFTVTTGQWTRVTCSFVAAGAAANNAILIRYIGTSGFPTYYIDNLSVNVDASATYAVDGSVDLALGSNWTAFGTLDNLTRDTTTIYDTSGSVNVDTPNSTDRGVRNNLAITPSVSTQYLVTFYARSSNSFSDIRVRYSRDGGTNFVSCVDYNTQTVSTTAFTEITCLFTTDSTTATNADLIIDQPTASNRNFYIDGLKVTLNTNNSNNVQVGGGNKGGPATLFTLDRSNGAPIAANNEAYLGSMYYDTSTGRIQCYEADGWGACGAAPDNVVNLNPEYAGAVLNGSGIGTMTTDFCSNDTALAINDTLCDTGEAKNYYRWTSPQASPQTYSIYVTYQLPETFNGFASDDTVQLVGRVDSTSNASVTYEMYKSTGSAVTQCGTGSTDIITGNSGVADNWYSYGINGNESTGCSFNSSSAGNFVIFKINMTANSNANAYISTLSFTTTGR